MTQFFNGMLAVLEVLLAVAVVVTLTIVIALTIFFGVAYALS